MRDELLSIVIPAYNRSTTIRAAIQSVLDQDDGQVEIVVVDDGSSDDTVAVVRDIEHERITVIAQDRQGAAAARNAGVVASTGSLISFLDSDDVLLPSWLTHVRAAFSSPADIVSCGAEDVDVHGTPTGDRRLPLSFGPAFGDHVALFAHGGTYAMRREVFEAVGGFVPGLRASQHTELALRVLPRASREGWRVASIPMPLVQHVVGRSDQIRGDDEAVLSGATYVLEAHGDQLRLTPGAYAAQASTAGVRAARLGRLGQARRWFWAACCDRPTDVRAWGRLVVSALPPLARRRWPDGPRSAR